MAPRFALLAISNACLPNEENVTPAFLLLSPKPTECCLARRQKLRFNSAPKAASSRQAVSSCSKLEPPRGRGRGQGRGWGGPAKFLRVFGSWRVRILIESHVLGYVVHLPKYAVSS